LQLWPCLPIIQTLVWRCNHVQWQCYIVISPNYWHLHNLNASGLSSRNIWKLLWMTQTRRVHISELFFTLMPYLSHDEHLRCFVVVRLTCACSTLGNSPWRWTSARNFILVSNFSSWCLTCHSTSV
jgi:hypothetical protein